MGSADGATPSETGGLSNIFSGGVKEILIGAAFATAVGFIAGPALTLTPTL